MKFYALVLILLACPFNGAMAQMTVAGIPDIGVLVGQNMTSAPDGLMASEGNPAEGAAGLLLGVTAENRFSKDLSLFGGILYAQRKFADDKTKFELDVLSFDVPFGVHYKFTESAIRPFATAAVAFIMNLSSTYRDSLGVENRDIHIADGLEIGAEIGAGIEYTPTKWVTVLGTVRYTHGFLALGTNADFSNDNVSAPTADVKIGLGVRINFQWKKYRAGALYQTVTPN